MPRKTKKEKIIRNLRRKLTALETNPTSFVTAESIEPRKEVIVEKKEPRFAPEKKEIILSVSDVEKTRLIKKDIIKTFALTALAIAFELVLYFTQGRG